MGDIVPGASWQDSAPEALGFNSIRLRALRAWVKTQDTTSMMVIAHGRVIFSYGDVTHTSKVASVRKSVLGILYGNYVSSGRIDLDKTVEQLGLQDKQPLLAIEKTATLRQLLESRSGIFLPTGSFGQQNYMPPRGSAVPGSKYVYNNWDFNAAGVAFERLTGKNIYDALESDLAVPLGMQDYRRADQVKDVRPETSFDEYVMRLSTRDMARIGLLMLSRGKWNNTQVVPGDWVRYMTTLVTPFSELNPAGLRNFGDIQRWGYGGALWWVWDEPGRAAETYTGPLQDAYTAMGAGGTFITILPAFDLLIVHQVDIERHPRASVWPSSFTAMIAMVVNSICG